MLFKLTSLHCFYNLTVTCQVVNDVCTGLSSIVGNVQIVNFADVFHETSYVTGFYYSTLLYCSNFPSLNHVNNPFLTSVNNS